MKYLQIDILSDQANLQNYLDFLASFNQTCLQSLVMPY